MISSNSLKNVSVSLTQITLQIPSTTVYSNVNKRIYRYACVGKKKKEKMRKGER
jgi:transposase-like protein